MIFTSYFANIPGIDPGRRLVSIARKTPPGVDVEPFPPLFPSPTLLSSYKNGKVDIEEYERIYREETLAKLNPKQIKRDLSGAVLLCYEKAGDFCHRNIVRKWLAENDVFSLEYKKSYRVAIVGSREYDRREEFEWIMDSLMKGFDASQKITIVSGGARGADSFAAEYAKNNGLALIEHPADWERYGKRAGFVRNASIWNDADFGIAFWDGKSQGTEHSFHLAKEQGKNLAAYLYTKRCFMIESNEPLFVSDFCRLPGL